MSEQNASEQKKMEIGDVWDKSSDSLKAIEIVGLAVLALTIVGFVVACVALAKANSNRRKIKNTESIINNPSISLAENGYYNTLPLQ